MSAANYVAALARLRGLRNQPNAAAQRPVITAFEHDCLELQAGNFQPPYQAARFTNRAPWLGGRTIRRLVQARFFQAAVVHRLVIARLHENAGAPPAQQYTGAHKEKLQAP